MQNKLSLKTCGRSCSIRMHLALQYGARPGTAEHVRSHLVTELKAGRAGHELRRDLFLCALQQG